MNMTQNPHLLPSRHKERNTPGSLPHFQVPLVLAAKRFEDMLEQGTPFSGFWRR
jgi:hypothetical protein